MSEAKGEYKMPTYQWYEQTDGTNSKPGLAPRIVLPQGEYTPPSDTEPDDTINRELMLNQLDGWIRELNLAIQEIQPFINQKKVTKSGMHGLKLIYPCATRFYKTLSQMQKMLYNLRRDGYR